MAARSRLVNLFRAASVDPEQPFRVVKDPYFWATTSANSLQNLIDIQVAVFLPEDKENFRSFLLSEERTNVDTLRQWGIDTQALRSPAMLQRGSVVKEMYDRFTSVLCQEGPRYNQVTTFDRKGSTRMGALASTSIRLPPGQDRYSAKGWAEGWAATRAGAQVAAHTVSGEGPASESSEGTPTRGSSDDNTSGDEEEDNNSMSSQRMGVRKIHDDDAATHEGNRPKRKRERDEDDRETSNHAKYWRDGGAPARKRAREESPPRGTERSSAASSLRS